MTPSVKFGVTRHRPYVHRRLPGRQSGASRQDISTGHIPAHRHCPRSVVLDSRWFSELDEANRFSSAGYINDAGAYAIDTI